ncbi:MAG: DoxX family protein [Gemmatimonadota bacterium]
MNDVVVPALLEYMNWALFLLRIWIALLFGWSGWSHVTKPRERGEGLGMSPAATFGLGAVELLGAVFLVIGLWEQAAAGAFIVVMLGAVWKKAFVSGRPASGAKELPGGTTSSCTSSATS